MTTKTDNYPELEQSLRDWAEDLIRTSHQLNPSIAGGMIKCARHMKSGADAIDALIKERDGAINRIDVLEQRASDWLERANSKYDTLARENERLREVIINVINSPLNLGNWTRQALRAALANAPTPNDKLDWDSCQHEWRARVDSQYHSETNLDVVCTKCQCPGDQNVKTGEVFWPAT